jgi:hypothetical protein
MTGTPEMPMHVLPGPVEHSAIGALAAQAILVAMRTRAGGEALHPIDDGGAVRRCFERLGLQAEPRGCRVHSGQAG